jgi:hypothetical protein
MMETILIGRHPGDRPRPDLLAAAMLFFLLSFNTAHPAMAADERPALDRVYRDVLDIGHKQVPLPEGDWRVAAIADEPPPPGQTAVYGVIDSAVLFKLNDNRIEAFILIHTNAVPVNHGWGVTRSCNQAAALTHIYDSDRQNAFCGFVRTVALRHDPGIPGVWQSAVAMATAHGWVLPEHWLMAGLRISDRHDVVEVRYHFDPDRFGPKPPAPDPGFDLGALWRQVTGDPSDDPIVHRLALWSESLRDPVERGFRCRLTGTPALPLPWTPAQEATAEATDGKAGPATLAAPGLGEIQALHEAGLLSDTQYRVQVQAASAPVNAQDPPAASPLLQTSVLKMMSWKVIGITSSLTIKYLFLGNPLVVAGLQAAQSIVSGALYVGYDMLWATLMPPSNGPVIDFETATVLS